MVNQQNATLIITGSAHGLVHLLMLSLPYITAKLLEVTAVPVGQEGLVVLLLNTPSYFIFGFGAIPAGILSDRWGPTKTIALGLFCSVASGIGLFFLWPLGLSIITVFFVLYSFGAGLYHPAGTAWVSETFVEDRGKALGRHGIGGAIGQALSPIISAVILSTVVWPFIFIFLATAGFIVAFICLRFQFDKTDYKSTTEALISERSGGFFSAMTVVVLGFMTVVLVARGMHYRGAVTALPTYLTRELQALLVLAGFFGTLIYIGGMIGQETGGRLTDKYGWQKTLISSCILSSLSLFILALPYVPTLINDALLMLAILLFGFGYFSAQAATNTMVASLSTPSNRGTVFGYSFFARFGFGALGIPIVSYSQLLFGTWTIGFILLGFLGLLASLCVPFIKQRVDIK